MTPEEHKVLEALCQQMIESNRWQKIQTLILGAIAAAVGVNLGGIV